MSSEDERQGAKGAADDVVLVHGRTEDGKGLAVLRKRGDTLAAGQMRPVEEGKAIHGEVVTLRPRTESPLLFDVDVLHGTPDGPRTGPAQVSTDSYRAGWQAIFGGEKGGRKPKPAGPSKKTLN